ncbi:MAG: pilus assembly protein N-terminal domain-containing protein [Planctomyces sp.]|nr:pilus assembly protein N-terminal domain-containing protein [Planctomyces sp.]
MSTENHWRLGCADRTDGGRSPGAGRLRPLARRLTCVVAGAAAAVAGSSAFAQTHWQPAAARYSAQGGPPAAAATIQTVSHQPVDPRQALDPRIAAMPQVDQKLQVIHHRSQLVRTRARISRITFSDPAIIDVVQYSETELSILGLGLGTTDLFLWFENDPEPLKYALTVVHDPSLDDQRRIDYGKIERKLQILYPNSKVYLIPLSRRVIVRGQARDAEEAARVMQTIRLEVANLEFAGRGFGDDMVNPAAYYGDPAMNGGAGAGMNNLWNSFVVDELQVPGEFMVKVRVRIAQLNHEQLRRYGVDLGVIFSDARNVVSSTMASTPVISGVFDNGRVAVLIDALTTNGTGKIIEDAALVTLSGNPAAFLAGGEFAVPTTVGMGGAAAATTSFRGYGTSVIATPTLVDNDLFRLQVVTELSHLDAGTAVGGIPGLNVKRVQTLVELREGQTIVLGGLYGRQQRAEVTRIPLLGELPIVGRYLFNTKRATEDENELLIVMTPELVRAIDADQQPPLPGFHVTHPDCYDFCKYNRTEGNPDLGHYQLLPYGHGQAYAEDAGYNVFNPAPAVSYGRNDLSGMQGYGPANAGGWSGNGGAQYGNPASQPYGAAPPAGYGPAPGGHGAPQGGYGPPPAGYGPPPAGYGPTPYGNGPTPAPAPLPQNQYPGGAEPQTYRHSAAPSVQQASGVRGVPRPSGTRTGVRR